MRAEILRNWKPKSEGFDIEIELNILVERGDLRQLKYTYNIVRESGKKTKNETWNNNTKKNTNRDC